ncbi:hemolysin family protein [Microvirga pudoricolor]|uniref:hemolysin family protein n=1 Tax=Microvirga pudoricolor TaxID=2778729 RepID=UPI0019527215|nr:hemolysin family protein [Microvirga pudoricolor]MBM6592658.1 HlyC/CorC family transporter [Microvirga pudoricolor]
MFELIIALVLVVLNGVFALSELAIVSARRPRLKTMAEQGRAGASTALTLMEDSGKFLSTVQIGITLVGILAGAFSGAALGAQLTAILEGNGVPPGVAEPLGYAIVIGLITYFSIVIGELVPKQLALRNPEAIACVVAPIMRLVSTVFSPVVWLLNASTRLIFKLLGTSSEGDSTVTEEEIKLLVGEAESAGVIEEEERRMISGVLRLGDRPVRGLMTPRTDVDWIDLQDDLQTIRQLLIETPHSRLPVSEGDSDNMLGVIQSREILAALLSGDEFDIRQHIRIAPIIPDTLYALDALSLLRESEVPMALVHDEYGHFEGVVTPADALEAIVGAFRSDAETPDPDAVRREDGSWLLAGSMPVDEMAEILSITLPESRSYHTVGGLVISELQHLPATGEHVETLGWRFEVVDLDGRRIDKVLATSLIQRAGSSALLS